MNNHIVKFRVFENNQIFEVDTWVKIWEGLEWNFEEINEFKKFLNVFTSKQQIGFFLQKIQKRKFGTNLFLYNIFLIDSWYL
jgi:hypothetical protein